MSASVWLDERPELGQFFWLGAMLTLLVHLRPAGEATRDEPGSAAGASFWVFAALGGAFLERGLAVSWWCLVLLIGAVVWKVYVVRHGWGAAIEAIVYLVVELLHTPLTLIGFFVGAPREPAPVAVRVTAPVVVRGEKRTGARVL